MPRPATARIHVLTGADLGGGGGGGGGDTKGTYACSPSGRHKIFMSVFCVPRAIYNRTKQHSADTYTCGRANLKYDYDYICKRAY